MRTISVLLFGFAALTWAQDAQRLTMPFSDPSMPRKLNVDVLMGSVTVKGYEGNEAIIEYSGRTNLRRNGPEPPAGMRRIGGSGGLEITEEANTIRIRHGAFMGGGGDMTIQVPVNTSVTVKTMTGQHLDIENISGEVEANNMNGQVNVTNVSGSVVAHSMNGKVTASLNRVTPDKSMSFSTMNGDVDVTLPADTKANFKMRADNGDIYSDFDVKLGTNTAPQVVEEKTKAGKVRRRARVDGSQQGTINGGGQEIRFTTFNGRILIHKK